jgi:hypothetical protein
MTRLTKEQLQSLNEMYASGKSIDTIADAFGLTASQVSGRLSGDRRIVFEDKDQSYRDNLKWAINAAGLYLRSKKKPKSCPNNAAWFLYQQALNEPKDFLTKVSQVESRVDGGESERELKKSTRHSIEEINSFLEKFNG